MRHHSTSSMPDRVGTSGAWVEQVSAREPGGAFDGAEFPAEESNGGLVESETDMPWALPTPTAGANPVEWWWEYQPRLLDFHVLPLRVGWSAVVGSGSSIVSVGRMIRQPQSRFIISS